MDEGVYNFWIFGYTTLTIIDHYCFGSPEADMKKLCKLASEGKVDPLLFSLVDHLLKGIEACTFCLMVLGAIMRVFHHYKYTCTDLLIRENVTKGANTIAEETVREKEDDN